MINRGAMRIAPRARAGAACAALLVAFLHVPAARAVNEITIENALPGNPESEWDVVGDGDDSIQGFGTDISVNQGETISFKVATDATDYRLDIYRMGYYGGLGARFIDSVEPSVSLPQNQPACLTDPPTGLVDCGNWTVSAAWNVPANATSGIYFAKLVREDPEDGRASHIVFVVRDDDGQSDQLFQTGDTTWQAYNQYGGNSLYIGSPAGRAYKVSYNRPFGSRGLTPEDFVFNAEYPMVRWLEANGYDVSYFTGIDADRHGAEILEHAVYLSVGHDEYWSAAQRRNVEDAGDAGVHLAFFSGNEVFWKTRWEPSIDGTATPYRTLVTYKETHANAKIDPLPTVWTGTWRDPRFSPPADGNRPENALAGTIFTVNCCTYAITVPSADGKMRFWRNTSVATLPPASTATLTDDTLGYEWDEDLDNDFRPGGQIRMSTTTVNVPQRILDYGSNYGPGTATHSLTLHRRPGGGLVFGAGTVQWAWGLDGNHDRGGSTPDVRMRQATVNLFADMGVQPASLQPGLVAASASTDHTAPTATVTAPTNGAIVTAGQAVAITGTASDSGGGVVGGVEVSVDGGITWHPANGRANWVYTWVPSATGPATVRSRATDDSANLGNSSAVVSVTVQGPEEGPGGPILVIGNPANPFGRYHAEILRAEGLNAFAVDDIAAVTPASLLAYDVVVLGEMALTPAQVTMLTDWVTAGGNLIAMRPDAQLAGLLGLTDLPTTLSDAYLLVNTATGPGVGIVGQTIQFHGTADRYTLNGATSLATLYSNASTPTANPAVTLRTVGTQGGQAAAFTYDLARSVVYTRQGNPAWAGQERDGTSPIRSDDMFFPNWIDFNKVAIPQADEQQRLLANLILQMNLDRAPLPRFWYFPRDERAVVVMTGDDHGSGGTVGRFDGEIAQSPPGCSVANWECVRSTSYIYPGTPINDLQAVAYQNQGLEISVHVNTGCADWTPGQLDSFFDTQINALTAQLPSIAPLETHRTHCIAWSDWASTALVSLDHGIRLDTNYYYWPASWVLDRPGMFTGSGMPMRFANLNGALIDVYQAATQMTDESGQTYPATANALLDNAIGALGYYGAFTANMHTDSASSAGSDAIIASAQARSVPVVSARQMLDWLDGRNGSSFGSIAFSIDELTFTLTVGSGANGLRAMVPATSSFGALVTSIRRNSIAVPYTLQTIKGMQYGVFDATAGSYVVQYLVPGDDDRDGYAEPQDCNDANPAVFPGAVEICNGVDDDCDGQTDEPFPDLGNACSAGVGECHRAGVRVCTGDGTATQCSAVPGTPTSESCDGLDNDCDGQTDEDFTNLGDPCSVGVGACLRNGTRVCAPGGGSTVCSVSPGAPSAEICDGIDNDCDNLVDESTSGSTCSTGQLGVCSTGITQCQAGTPACVPNASPSAETCNGLDDDCDGGTDEGNPGGGGACSTGVPGLCAPGTFQCQGGVLRCVADAAVPEVCNNLDDDCDGITDNGDPGGGGACPTGEQGVCAVGTQHCENGSVQCTAPAPGVELCNSGADENCNGQTDETPCDPCLPANTVSNAEQTKRTKLRLRETAGRDKVLTKGTFTLPPGLTIDPANETVSVRIRDGQGLAYQATLPAGSFAAASNGKSFRFIDRTLAHDGVKTAKFRLRGGAVKYLLKAQGLDQPAFTAGAGTVTIQIGTRCFTDSADTCTLNPAASAASCR
jgi:N,N-dimethylformamidase beta subunit-like, C-terminal/Putative metal-binding motif/Bacterial Ig domain